ncbi:hypothetical protein [Aerosakkonema funiforme]|uniref:hypothetical protein n=1 Tax=Aerosakkonema funiforme TaxID=1246630 RepID=UPI0035B99A26
MIGFILVLILFVSPTLIILWSALSRVGFVWSLLWILAGSIIGGLLLAIAGAVFYGLLTAWDDRRTGPPEAGAISAGLGRTIVTLIFMVMFGWIGSGLGAFLAFNYLVHP